MPVSKTMTILNNYGKPLAQVSEYITNYRFSPITKRREFKPLSSDHFLAADDIHLCHYRKLETGEKDIVAYSGDPVNGKYITSGFDNVRKLIKSIKQGIHVNRYNKDWYKRVFGE